MEIRSREHCGFTEIQIEGLRMDKQAVTLTATPTNQEWAETSVEDPDPGSGVFYPPDPGWSNGRIRIRDKTSRIRNTDRNESTKPLPWMRLRLVVKYPKYR
jgi:hypothetical protein